MSLTINKSVIHILKNTQEISDIIGNKIYPLIAPKNTSFPYITLKRVNILSEYTKEETGYDGVAVDVEIFTELDKYVQGVELAEIVRNTLLGVRNQEIKGNAINQIRLKDSDEDIVVDKDGNTASLQIVTVIIKVC